MLVLAYLRTFLRNILSVIYLFIYLLSYLNHATNHIQNRYLQTELTTMVNQEYILSLIQKEAWKPVLDFLYKHKKEIPTDSLLQYSTYIFESEFFGNI